MSLASNERGQELKHKYGRFYEALVQLLAEDDPMNLVRMGAPSNEYEPEVGVILLRLDEAGSPSILGQIIYEAFVRCFGATFAPSSESPSERTKARFVALGESVWNLWECWKAQMPKTQ